MDTRRDFIKKAAFLAGGTGLAGALPPSIRKALAIDPRLGSTWKDAEHVVLLMQENRSFDHCYGTLRGVRGFNDPRAITLPEQNKVWLQTDKKGDTYAPFRLNIKDSKATWVGSLPHSWSNQVDAANNGKHNQWLEAKRSGNHEIHDMPWTMGYYTREDLPFYYALADAFTVCDQNFCSSLTGTTPNRLYFWSGTIKEEQNEQSRAYVRNDDVDYPYPAHWKTFPERLEEAGISWKIYQNELSLDSGFEGEEDAWLSNFTDNPIEWFARYNVKFAPSYQRLLAKLLQTLPGEIKALEAKTADTTLSEKDRKKLEKELTEKKAWLPIAQQDIVTYSKENFDKLSETEKNLHRKAFDTNHKDPDYRSLDTYHYQDGNTPRQMMAPKGDVLHQFRDDVKNGQLPAVSWLVAPENFSDHPGAPWYGAWYVSEVMDILTQDPEVWKKTIFILAYDENDGIFDHVPPFTPPYHPGTGHVSKGIDTGVEHVSMEQELAHIQPHDARESSIGLGFRVPLVIASPWSRGGFVNSEVFDHTSSLQFLEKFIEAKFNKKIEETNISAWRRTVCGDLSTTFRPWNGEKMDTLPFSKRNDVLETVHNAKFRSLPTTTPLTKEEIAQANQDPAASPHIPNQEPGIRPACALPYQLYADGHFDVAAKSFRIDFAASNEFFGPAAIGSPFKVYAPGKFTARDKTAHPSGIEEARSWSYALTAGDKLSDTWSLEDFTDGGYHLRVYGPNGFFREFAGPGTQDPLLDVTCDYHRLTGKNTAAAPASKDAAASAAAARTSTAPAAHASGKNLSAGRPTGSLEITIRNLDPHHKQSVEIVDNAYKSPLRIKELGPAGSSTATATLVLDLSHSHQWYDFSVRLKGATPGSEAGSRNLTNSATPGAPVAPAFERRFAGRVETGHQGFTDPLMGRV